MSNRLEGYPFEDDTVEHLALTTTSNSGNLAEFPRNNSSKELDEHGPVKMELIGVLDTFVQELTSEGSYEIIDSIVGEEGASVKLAKDISSFAKKIVNQCYIVEKSHALDVFKNINASMLGFAKIVRRRSLQENVDIKDLWQNFENQSKIINDNFCAIKMYLHLMEKYHEFWSAEMGSRGGLGDRLRLEDFEIKSSKPKYVEWAEKALLGNKK